MKSTNFNIQLLEIHWLESYGDEDELDLCAHGEVFISIGDEIIVELLEGESFYLWSITAMAFHLLRTLELDHTIENPVGDCLVPGEGHVIDHFPNDPTVHIETVYPMVEGRNWQVIHEGNNVKLITESKLEVLIPFEEYKNEILSFVDKVEDFYKISKSKVLPKDEYDRDGYLKMWNEWYLRRKKWK